MEVKLVSALERFQSEKMAKVNLFETPRFFCDLYCLRPGQEQKIHSHARNDKIYYVLRGEVVTTVGAESRVLGPGEMTLAPACEPHGIRNESTVDAVCMVFMAPHPDH